MKKTKKIKDKSLCRITKLPTHIPGFDAICDGGIPKGRTTLVSGSAGSAKTVLAAQFLVEGIRNADESGVFVTFEEHPDDIRKNLIGFGWDIAKLEREGKWVFVDVSPELTADVTFSGSYDLGALLVRIEHAINKIGAKRISLDSIGAIFSRFDNRALLRKEMLLIASAIKKMGVTAVLTSERTAEYGEISRYGIEEFVADNVIILRNALDGEKRRRTIEILKFRGTNHQKGEYPFTIVPGEGLIVIPLSAIDLVHNATDERIPSGNDALDEMCGGGFFADSILLISGATGTGKTLMATEFVSGGIRNNERCLLLTFEESREQFFRNAAGWGRDLYKMEKKGLLKVISRYPETAGIEDHLLHIKREVDAFKPKRLALDSLSALEHVASVKGFREFVIGITAYLKKHRVSGLFTSTTPTLMGGESITETHISTMTDMIILLRYVEMYGEMLRGITVLKMRGSRHDKNICQYTIDNHGMHIGSPFRHVTGIVAGHPVYMTANEMDRLSDLFRDKSSQD